MTDQFDITRAQAAAGIANGLRAIQYNTVLASWKHSTGTLLSVETPNESLGIYVVAWRSTAHYAATFECVKVFINADRDLAWAEAMQIARSAFPVGPGPALLEAREAIRVRKSASGKTGGEHSGKTRAAKAADRQKSLSSPEQANSPDSEKGQTSENTAISAPDAEISAPVQPAAAVDTTPFVNPNLPNWRMEAQRDFPHIVWAFMYYPNGKFDKDGKPNVKDKDGTSIVWSNLMRFRNGTVLASATKEQIDHAWSVERYFRSSPEGSLNGETIAEGLHIDEVCLLVNRIAETTDPTKWVRGDFKR